MYLIRPREEGVLDNRLERRQWPAQQLRSLEARQEAPTQVIGRTSSAPVFGHVLPVSAVLRGERVEQALLLGVERHQHTQQHQGLHHCTCSGVVLLLALEREHVLEVEEERLEVVVVHVLAHAQREELFQQVLR